MCNNRDASPGSDTVNHLLRRVALSLHKAGSALTQITAESFVERSHVALLQQELGEVRASRQTLTPTFDFFEGNIQSPILERIGELSIPFAPIAAFALEPSEKLLRRLS